MLISADNATAYGGSGADRLNGTGNSTLYGDAGNDVLTWYSTDDDGGADARLFGGDGDDRLSAFPWDGDDIKVRGNAGNDFLFVNRDAQGFGGTGNDTLFSTGGGTLISGSGTDLFFVNAFWSSGHDPLDTVTIADFDRTQDRLQIDLNGQPSEIRIANDGTDTTISILWNEQESSGSPIAGLGNATIVIKGVTGITLDDVTFSRGLGWTSESGWSDNSPSTNPTPLTTDGNYDDIRLGTNGADRITLSGDQPLVLAGDGDDSVTGANGERRGYIILGDGNGTFTDGTGHAFV